MPVLAPPHTLDVPALIRTAAHGSAKPAAAPHPHPVITKPVTTGIPDTPPSPNSVIGGPEAVAPSPPPPPPASN
jgi:hypothetical protein